MQPSTTFRFPHEIRGWLSQAEGECLARLGAGRTVLEVGSYCGRSTVCLAQCAARVTSIDWHRGDPHIGEADTLAEFEANLVRYGVRDRVDVRVGRFEDLAGDLRTDYDLVFLDACHDYESVREYVALAARVLRPGGTLALHDYANPDYPGVRQAADEARVALGRRLPVVVDSLGVMAPRDGGAATPLVTVVTPTRGRDATLRRAVASVAAQTYPAVEHVVVGDGESPALDAHGRLRVFGLGQAWGDYGATPRLAGALLARGEYVCYLDDDNVFLPDHVESLVDLIRDTGVDFVYSRARRMDLDTGDVLDEVGEQPPRLGGIDTSVILHDAALLRRAAWRPSGYAADWDLVARWLEAGATYAFLDRVTVHYHLRMACDADTSNSVHAAPADATQPATGA